jgi:hypothetical protein
MSRMQGQVATRLQIAVSVAGPTGNSTPAEHEERQLDTDLGHLQDVFGGQQLAEPIIVHPLEHGPAGLVLGKDAISRTEAVAA